MNDRKIPQINAGSMADIAFLLLIFFLVTTTLNTEVGIQKKIPKESKEIINIKEKNLLEISLNSDNEIFVENNLTVPLQQIKQLVIGFIDNGAGKDANGNTCSWCNGNKDANLSDHPTKAIVQLQANRNTSYGHYIAVQNEVIAAYTELRNSLAVSLYGKNYSQLLLELKKSKNNLELASKIQNVQNRYPLLIIESNTSY